MTSESIDKNKPTEQTTWNSISEQNGWPDPIYLKNLTEGKTKGFPYSRGGFRNKVTGKNADKELAGKSFFVGKLAAIRRADLVEWLDARTKGRN